MPVRRVAVIDDSLLARELTRKVLHAVLGDDVAVDLYADARSARRALPDALPDYLVIDHAIGDGEDGLSLLDQLRAAGVACPAGLVTANLQAHVIEAAERRGARFIAKPVTPDKLRFLQDL